MASESWAAPVSGDWNTVTDWSPAAVPNSATDDVTIDSPTQAAYVVTIATGENETVGSLTMNATNNLLGSNENPYQAAELVIDGTLTFGAGSPGLINGSLQTYIAMSNGTIVNPGTLNAFIQTEGSVLLTGTNGLYITSMLQAVGGVTTVDTKSIAELTGNTLFDGIFEAQAAGGVVNLGGPRQNLIVNIATIEGPPLVPAGWTELILNGTPTEIGEWTGSGYVGIETTLTNIASRGTFDVIGSRDYTSAKTLSIAAGGLLNLRAGTVTTGGIDINGGTVQGSGTINSGVVNNGTLRALDGLLTVGAGGLVGTGIVTFDFDQQRGTVAATGSVMEVHGVGPGQTFIMNGDDQLVLDTPVSFAGTIQAKSGDEILLGGVSATSATLQGQTLLLQNNGQTVDSLNLAGSYTGDFFNVAPFGTGSTELKISGPNFTVQDTTAGTTTVTPGTIYTGPVPGLQYQYTNLTTDSLNITATAPNVFISAGSGVNALNVSGVNGNNVLDGGSGSSFMTGGTGDDTFYVDVSNATTSIFSTIAGFHSGDNATIFGVTLADFNVALFDNIGAPGFTGLDFAFTQPGHPTANLVIAGYSTADLVDGKLSQAFGTTPSLPGLPGTPYLTIHAT
jgi:hypothetical protein